MTDEGRTDLLLTDLTDLIVDCDAEGATAKAEELLTEGVDPVLALKTTLDRAARIVGEKFDSGEYFLPHLVMAGDAMTVVAEVLEAAFPKGEASTKKTVLIATVEADLHSVGKNIVGMMLRAAGFNVVDLGVDVKSSAIIAKAKEVNADIIALSSLLTTTMPYQREVIDDLKAVGLRDRFTVMVGGGAVTKQWADQIGADGYGRDAIEAVKVAKVLVETAAAARTSR